MFVVRRRRRRRRGKNAAPSRPYKSRAAAVAEDDYVTGGWGRLLVWLVKTYFTRPFRTTLTSIHFTRKRFISSLSLLAFYLTCIHLQRSVPRYIITVHCSVHYYGCEEGENVATETYTTPRVTTTTTTLSSHETRRAVHYDKNDVM